MEYDIEDGAVFSKLNAEGRLQLYLHLSNYSEEDEGFWSAICAWYEEEDRETVLRINFRLADALEWEIEGETYPLSGNLSLEAKPRIDAMRAELLAMLERIDAISWASETEEREMEQRMTNAKSTSA